MPRSPLIRIYPLGRAGNQMFQLMLAESIKVYRPDALINGYDLRPLWPLFCHSNPRHNRGLILRLGSHHVPLEETRKLLASIDDIQVDISGLGIRMFYYADMLDKFRMLFRPSVPAGIGLRPNANDLLIHVRLGDNMSMKHPNYFPLPLSYYKQLLAATHLNPIFMGQIDDGPYCQSLRKAFPAARFLPMQSPAEDFEMIRSAVHIAPSISTFAWLAAWLSENAISIHLPLAGMLNPVSRPQIDLLPEDKRYKFYKFNIGSWADTSLDDLINGWHGAELLTYQNIKSFASHVGSDGVRRSPAILGHPV